MSILSDYKAEPAWGVVLTKKVPDETQVGGFRFEKRPLNSQTTWGKTHDETLELMQTLGSERHFPAHVFRESDFFCFDYDAHERAFTPDELKEIETLKGFCAWDRGTSGDGYHFYCPKFTRDNVKDKVKGTPELFFGGNCLVVLGNEQHDIVHALTEVEKDYLLRIYKRIGAFYTDEERLYRSKNPEVKDFDWGEVTVNPMITVS